MDQFKITINNTEYTVNAAAQTPLLWVIRDNLGLTGTKYGCGIAQCGACTVHINEMPIRSCSIPVSAAIGKKITTIEGVSDNGDHPVQEAWVQESVAQCGYCQSGQIMSAIALLNKNKKPSATEIDIAMRGNICRCGTYSRIKQAIYTAASKMNVTNN